MTIESTFDRSYAQNLLDGRLEKFIKEFEGDVSISESNIRDKTLLRPALAAKWCRYEYEEKRYKSKIEEAIEKLKVDIAKTLWEKKKEAIVSQQAGKRLIEVEAEKAIKTDPKYVVLKSKLDEQDEIIRFIGEAKQIISQFGFDLKNSIEILKLEQI